MDAFEVGYAMAFPEALLDGLEAMGAAFELLDAAAVAAGDDPALAAGAFQEFEAGWAPSDVVASGEDAGGMEPIEGGGSDTAGPVQAKGRGMAGGGRPARRRRGRGGAGPERGAGDAPVPDRGAGGDPGTAAAVAREGAAMVASTARSRSGRGGRPHAERARSGGFGPSEGEGADRELSERGFSGRAASDRRGSGRGSGGRGASGRTAAAAYARGAEERVQEGGSAAPDGEPDGDGGGDELLPTMTARVEDGVSSRGLDASVAPGASARPGGFGAGLEGRSAAPDMAGSGARGATPMGAPMGGLFDEQAAAPQQDEGGGAGGGTRPVMLDGRLVGHWLSERMARDAGRPGAGTTFFDPRQAPAWTPSGSL